MKEYNAPALEIVRLNSADIVTNSVGDTEFDDIEW